MKAIVLGVVALVGLAGCASEVGTGSADPTVEAAPVAVQAPDAGAEGDAGSTCTLLPLPPGAKHFGDCVPVGSASQCCEPPATWGKTSTAPSAECLAYCNAQIGSS